ncbi:GroES-like protein [Wallemia mellicola]|uniref:GroES-like protein n=1 Tax=Wallemia mellicola TaxID=1708541 RepID=A0A4V4MLR1_9BASI|nr:GroES-like protein [Wallemia mellicola]TIB97914.1 GroES-like protein [Wallemia mellicola]TIC00473.1 GroES-like protein [Wallemia mellicola]TIC16136.1 GroES-like protein [Wallemia mellicola]TIC19539.1 GroES-like protein [Wallemia mellicola]
MTEFKAYRGTESGKIVESTGKVGDIGSSDVLIKLTHAGLCFTDVHFIEAGIVLGHEPVGKVEKTGSDVKHLSEGDVVGYGYVHGSCDTCDECRSGNDTLCPSRQLYGETDTDFGGFGKYAKVNERFVHKIPAGMAPEHAAPLQCAGATVFCELLREISELFDVIARLSNCRQPFLKYDIKPIHRVGVIGIGGLGHLALQVANKWGCSVGAFTTSESKADEAKSFGAHDVIVTKRADGESFVPKSDAEKFDFILCTVSGQVPWDQYIDCLKPRGVVIPLGVDFGKFETNRYFSLLARENKVGGSFVATRFEHYKMLEFCARHSIKPAIEMLDLNEENINTAFDRLQKNDVRYRFVLKHSE